MTRSSLRALPACLLLAFAALAGPATAAEPDHSGFHVAVLAGAGTGYGLVGGNVELRYSHVALDLGAGVLAASDAGGPNGGVRLFLDGQGRGPMLSVHGTLDVQSAPTPPDRRQILAGATLGWRFRFNHLLLDLGAGVAYYRSRSSGSRSTNDGPLPDLDLGIGWEF